MMPFLDIFSKAMEIETRTKATNEETRRMFRLASRSGPKRKMESAFHRWAIAE
jgi:hypothetical protein